MIYNGSKRKAPLEFPIVALSLYQLFYKKTGDPKFSTRQALTSKFGISQHTEVILSGTEKDLALERWWALSNRDKVVENLLELGIKMVTTPNYSLFDDVPRTDNLYNMKRIALTCLELKRWGMPVALHINGRTERDYERWTEFLTEHDELDMLAFEFGTGAGRLTRIEWHAKQLQILAQKVNRPLTLIMRGGLPEYPTLKSAFQAVVFIDTDSFLRAQHRQVGCFDSGKIIWTPRETAIGEPIDNLIIQNVSAKSQYVDYLATKLT